jgi:hypothetical protein
MVNRAQPFSYARYIEEVWNSHNSDALAAYFAPDTRDHSLDPGGIDSGAGLDYLKEPAQLLFKRLPRCTFHC